MQLEVNIFIRWKVPPSDLYALIGYSVSTRSHRQGGNNKRNRAGTKEAKRMIEEIKEEEERQIFKLIESLEKEEVEWLNTWQT